MNTNRLNVILSGTKHLLPISSYLVSSRLLPHGVSRIVSLKSSDFWLSSSTFKPLPLQCSVPVLFQASRLKLNACLSGQCVTDTYENAMPPALLNESNIRMLSDPSFAFRNRVGNRRRHCFRDEWESAFSCGTAGKKRRHDYTSDGQTPPGDLQMPL